MRNYYRQTGLTLISWLIILALLMFLVWFCIRVFPIYFNYFQINSSLSTVAKNMETGETPEQIRLGISNLITINNISDITAKNPHQINIAPAPDGNGYIITLDYTSQTSFIGNVSLLVHFHRDYKAQPR